MEQPQAIGRALCFGGRLSLDTATLGGLDEKYDKLTGIESMSVVGCGSSFNAATYGTKLLRHMGVFANVSAMDANSAEESDFRVLSDAEKHGLLILSQSGETKGECPAGAGNWAFCYKPFTFIHSTLLLLLHPCV